MLWVKWRIVKFHVKLTYSAIAYTTMLCCSKNRSNRSTACYRLVPSHIAADYPPQFWLFISHNGGSSLQEQKRIVTVSWSHRPPYQLHARAHLYRQLLSPLYPHCKKFIVKNTKYFGNFETNILGNISKPICIFNYITFCKL